jgi:multidrug transporter EmrE-like cation transporter
MMAYISIFFIGTFIASCSPIILKKAAGLEYKGFWDQYLNRRVIGAYILLFISSFFPILAFRGIPMNFGPILESSGYLFVSILSLIFLKEKISKKTLMGLGIIIAGIVVYAW